MPPGLKGKEIHLRDFIRTIFLGNSLTSSSTIHILELLAKSGPWAKWEDYGIVGELCSDTLGGRAPLWDEQGQMLLQD